MSTNTILSIEQIRAQLADVTKQVAACRNAGIAMAADKNSTAAELQAKAAELEGLKARADMLRTALDDETERQSGNLKAMKSANDSIQTAADKFKSMGDFFSVVARASNRENPQIDPRLQDYMNIRSAATGQNLTTDAEGGYLVPPDYAAGLLNVAQSESVLFPEVTRVPVSGNRLIVNELDQESRENSTEDIKGRNGGLLAYWIGEAQEYTASKMKFKQNQTDMSKLTGLCYATEEMLEDLPAMSSYISQGFADEFTFKLDDSILNGTGNGMPTGVLNSANKALVTIAKEADQGGATVLLNNILKMYNAMPAKNRARAKWYINQDLEIVLMQLMMNVGATAEGPLGMPLFLPAGSLTNSPNGVLLGRPIVPIEQASALGTMGDITLMDLSQYRWIDKSGINAQTSLHVRFLQDETAFKFTYRAGGKPIWSNTIKAYKGGTERSPYVALATRA